MKSLLNIIISTLVCLSGYTQTIKQISEAKKQEALAVSTHKITPPISVRAAFAKDHPGTEVSWKKERGHFEGSFLKEGKNMSVIYGDSGNMIESETIINRSQIPASIKDYMSSHYKGDSIRQTVSMKKANGEENYEVVLNGLYVFFSKDGKFIKAIKD